MNPPFADTCFWIALMNPRDDLHHQARALSKQHAKIITNQEVLSEFMNFFCGRGEQLRQTAIRLVRSIENNKLITVLEQTSKSFSQGMDLYANRVDKEYSFIDCVSMASMKERKIFQILTNDHHFAQEGLEILM